MRSNRFILKPIDNVRLANLCGPRDENLRQIERALDVQINRQNDRFSIIGEKNSARNAELAIKKLYQNAEQSISIEAVQLILIEISNLPEGSHLNGSQPISSSSRSMEIALMTRKDGLGGRTANQAHYIEEIQNNDICFGIGPAGTGKTYLAVACAVDAFERELVERIILTRPAVEAGERLGFLPGDLAQKVDPFLRPLYDALYELMGFERVTKCLERGSIEIAPLAFMRGRTLSRAFIILDEAQNTSPEQMKMFLTRIGIGAKAVITGDLTQIDLPRGQKSGLEKIQEVLSGVRGISFLNFGKHDVVRHPLVARIVAAYEIAKNNGIV